MEEREKLILDFMKEEQYVPMKAKEIALFLEVPKQEYREFTLVLDRLEKQYFIKSIRKGVLRFFKALHLYHSKHLKQSILFIIMFCISGLYNYYFIQNHTFAFNNHDLIESTLNNLELSTNGYEILS